MAQRPPDPVSDPAQYQRFLLGLLADDDPADVQAATPTRIRALVAEAGDRLRTRPKPDEWSVLECIGHIVDGELFRAAATGGSSRTTSRHSSATTRISGSSAYATTNTTWTSYFRSSRVSGARTAIYGHKRRWTSVAASESTPARPRELRADVPADRRPRPQPPRAGAPGSRRGLLTQASAAATGASARSVRRLLELPARHRHYAACSSSSRAPEEADAGRSTPTAAARLATAR